MKKLVRYRIPISITFPATHKRSVEYTYFIQKIFSGLGFEIYWDNFKKNMSEMGVSTQPISDFDKSSIKLHTCRKNYQLWAKRFEKINRGEAVLELYCWSGKPYNSKCVTICQLGRDDGIGIQQIDFDPFLGIFIDSYDSDLKLSELAKNDGLSFEDFKEWFRKYNLSESLAIIHFTSFRY